MLSVISRKITASQLLSTLFAKILILTATWSGWLSGFVQLVREVGEGGCDFSQVSDEQGELFMTGLGVWSAENGGGMDGGEGFFCPG